ncbi:hypothetical protein J7E62_27625 [Variovorax paradoxus]|nr:hypothetical protein [Variovorax paradoxus]
MTTITLWLLISVAGSNRPATVIERFHTAQQCEQARANLDAVNYLKTGACVRVEAAR